MGAARLWHAVWWIEPVRKLSELLNQKKIQHAFNATSGAHTARAWRVYPREFLTSLFKRGGKP